MARQKTNRARATIKNVNTLKSMSEQISARASSSFESIRSNSIQVKSILFSFSFLKSLLKNQALFQFSKQLSIGPMNKSEEFLLF